jgi:ribonucleoside-diphosphate reductase alpha chain
MAKFDWLNKDSRTFLERGYLLEGVTPEERIKEIADEAERILGIRGFSNKFYDYMSRGWFSLSSPVWANFGLERGLPISCFGSYIGDSVESILGTAKEVGMMSKYGGGTSAYFGHIRGRGSKITDNGESNGSYPFARIFDTLIDVVSQGSTRRGYMAGYIDIEHPDILEWLDALKEGNPIQLMYYGVCVGDDWLQEMKDGDQAKRETWAKVIEARGEVGVPYIMFKDTVNRNTVDVYRNEGRTIYASNLCSEICLPSNEEESFVCCLSSMNLLHYDEWKDTDAVEILTIFLDAVMTEFIRKTEGDKDMVRAHTFAKNHRALGLGVLGWHDYLQSKNIAFDSFDAMQHNVRIHKDIKEKAYIASRDMAKWFGEPPVLKGYGRRNTTLLAIAPTKSSSFILGQVSQTIQPHESNYYIRDAAKIKVTVKNPFLTRELARIGKDTREVWKSIKENNGSVQHLDFLSDHLKKVYETSFEISQLSIIQQAAQRQKYICQSQSLNVMIHPKTSIKEINELLLTAHQLGVKTLYYQNNLNAAQEFKRNLLTCASCES